jgi:glycosyltransferase involved in cell wall biosynthesis
MGLQKQNKKKIIYVISHAMIVEENQKRWKIFSQLYPDYGVKIFVPQRWIGQWFGQCKIYSPLATSEDNFEVIPVNVTHQSHWGRYIPLGMVTYLKKDDPDFVFIMQEEFTWSVLWISLIKSLFAVRAQCYFFSWQNIKISKDKWWKKIWWLWLQSTMNGMIAGTHEIAQLFTQANWSLPILCQTEIGVDGLYFSYDPALREKARSQYQISDEQFVIGFCGRLVEEKGVLDLWQACLECPFDWKLVLVGDGILRQTLEEQAKTLQLSSRLLITGEIPVTETKGFYHMMDCFVLPSRTTSTWKEQFGLALAQAMSIGIPVIGSSSGAIPEVIGDSQWIFEEGNREELREKIKLCERKRPKQQLSPERFFLDELSKDLYRFLNTAKISP